MTPDGYKSRKGRKGLKEAGGDKDSAPHGVESSMRLERIGAQRRRYNQMGSWGISRWDAERESAYSFNLFRRASMIESGFVKSQNS
jgi:hypothetical protein